MSFKSTLGERSYKLDASHASIRYQFPSEGMGSSISIIGELFQGHPLARRHAKAILREEMKMEVQFSEDAGHRPDQIAALRAAIEDLS